MIHTKFNEKGEIIAYAPSEAALRDLKAIYLIGISVLILSAVTMSIVGLSEPTSKRAICEVAGRNIDVTTNDPEIKSISQANASVVIRYTNGKTVTSTDCIVLDSGK